ncbi:MAG: hypothetical protein O7F11_00100 [Acidobacteria bacterium]|jgi:hypothetical protein|nr:hypothetical protein [Acidobacteriota bacterium]
MAKVEAGHMPARKGGCFKTGCFGCLGVILLMVVLPLGWAFIEMARGVPETRRETQELTRVLPAGLSPPEGGLAGVPAGRVYVDFSMAEFIIEPGPAGQPIRVEADFDTATYELIEEYQAEGELGWTYRVSFRPKVSWLRRLLAGSLDENNRVRLILPRGTPMSLAGDLGVGESDVELGGLWLTDVALDISVGEHKVRFSEPLAQPLETLRVSSWVGEVKVTRIGNASPSQVTLSHSIGEVYFDLRGEWRNDSEVEVTCGIGECGVRLPGKGVNVDLVRASISIGDQRAPKRGNLGPTIEGAPTIHVDITGTLGELTVDD